MSYHEQDQYHPIYPQMDRKTGLYPFERPVEPPVNQERLSVEEIQKLRDDHYKKLMGACPVLGGHF